LTCKCVAEKIDCFRFSYDFDKDGFVIKEDVRLILSHIPIEQSLDVKQDGEGKFTSSGGGR